MALFYCVSCDIKKDVPDQFIGRKVRCPGCSEAVVVQGQASGEAMGSDAPAEDDDWKYDTSGINLDNEVFEAGEGESAPAVPEIPAKPSPLYCHCSDCGYSEETESGKVGAEIECPECGGNARVLTWAQMDQDFAEDLDPEDLAVGINRSEDDRSFSGDSDAFAPVALAVSRESVLSLLSGNLVANVLSGLVSGLLMVVFAVALAALITPILFPDFFQNGLTMALVSAAAAGLYVALCSRIRFGLAGPEVATVAVLFLILSQAAGVLDGADPQAVMVTLAALVAGAAFMTALVSVFLGVFAHGDWVRFVPIQIVGGVFAGVGVYLLLGAYQYMTGKPLNADAVIGLLQPGAFSAAVEAGAHWAWLPGTIFGWVLFVLFMRVRASLLLLLVTVVAGSACALSGALDLSALGPALSGCGELGHRFSLFEMLWAYDPANLGLIRWDVLGDFKVHLTCLAVLAVVNAMYKMTLLEGPLGRELVLVRELRVLGMANLLSGGLGGMPATVSMGRSLGNKDMGASGPVSGIMAALVCGSALLWIGYVLPFVPTYLPAGLLVFVGLVLIKRWLVDIRVEIVRPGEYPLLLLCFAVTVGVGFVMGVGVGLVLALVVAVSRYATAGAVKRSFSGTNLRSKVDRAPAQLDALKKGGDSIHAFQLKGFVSKGTFHTLIGLIAERADESGANPLKSVIIDFTSVNGFGSGLVRGFAKLHGLAQERSLRIVPTNVPFEVEEQLRGAGFDLAGGPLKLVTDLDYAMELCEDAVLADAGLLFMDDKPLAHHLRAHFSQERYVDGLMQVLREQAVSQGDYVFRQGDESDAMYFIESGQFAVELALPGGKSVRLKKLGPGSVFGEMGLYTDAPRSASIRAERNGVIYRLSRRVLEDIREKVPVMSSAIDGFLVRMLSERVADANDMVRDLKS